MAGIDGDIELVKKCDKSVLRTRKKYILKDRDVVGQVGYVAKSVVTFNN